MPPSSPADRNRKPKKRGLKATYAAIASGTAAHKSGRHTVSNAATRTGGRRAPKRAHAPRCSNHRPVLALPSSASPRVARAGKCRCVQSCPTPQSLWCVPRASLTNRIRPPLSMILMPNSTSSILGLSNLASKPPSAWKCVGLDRAQAAPEGRMLPAGPAGGPSDGAGLRKAPTIVVTWDGRRRSRSWRRLRPRATGLPAVPGPAATPRRPRRRKR